MTDRVAQCFGKVGFESAALARQVAQRRNRRTKTHRKQSLVYRCSYCGRWHIGRPDGLPKGG